MDETTKTIENFWNMRKGERIKDPDKKLAIGQNIYISRRSLKHVVEGRKSDKYPICKIKNMFTRLPSVISEPDLVTKNINQKYTDSLISRKLYDSEKEMLFIIHITEKEKTIVITAFYRSIRKLK